VVFFVASFIHCCDLCKAPLLLGYGLLALFVMRGCIVLLSISVVLAIFWVWCLVLWPGHQQGLQAMFVCSWGLLIAIRVVPCTVSVELGSLLLSYFPSEGPLRLVVGGAIFKHGPGAPGTFWQSLGLVSLVALPWPWWLPAWWPQIYLSLVWWSTSTGDPLLYRVC